MDCSFIEERNRLARTVALLLSFALMAERVAFGTYRERRHLIDILRKAEASGLRLAGDYGDWEDGTELPDIGRGYRPDNAIRLAVSLRAIAMALYFHLKQFDAYSAFVQDWVAPQALKVDRRPTTKPEQRCTSHSIDYHDTS